MELIQAVETTILFAVHLGCDVKTKQPLTTKVGLETAEQSQEIVCIEERW